MTLTDERLEQMRQHCEDVRRSNRGYASPGVFYLEDALTALTQQAEEIERLKTECGRLGAACHSVTDKLITCDDLSRQQAERITALERVVSAISSDEGTVQDVIKMAIETVSTEMPDHHRRLIRHVAAQGERITALEGERDELLGQQRKGYAQARELQAQLSTLTAEVERLKADGPEGLWICATCGFTQRAALVSHRRGKD